MNAARRQAWRLPLGLLSLMALPALGRETPPLPGLALRGKSTLRFLGLAIYEARLWTGAGFDADRYATQRLVLELEYFRSLRGAEIVERSLVEMRRIEPIGAERESAWRALMLRAFPDVGKGDQLSGEHDGAGAVRFVLNGRPTASTQDLDFARLFFGIWLSPKTSEPDLRLALIAA